MKDNRDMKSRVRAIALGARDLARDAKNGLRLKSSFLAAKRRGDILKRIAGLEPLLESAKGSTLLDLGCFDGLIAYEFFRSGARVAHGLDNDALHLATASRIFAQVAIPSRFVHADLRKPDAVSRALADHGLPKYDIVLFLGVFQHIFRPMTVQRRQELVAAIVDRVGSFLAVRMPEEVWKDFECLLPGHKLELVRAVPQIGYVGELRIYRCK
jgi:2-polyprenyl-3-methyl-5-hydroxy-6-metoxy-1,4-benzoquinol methylase